ncbi:Uncharacterised protein [Serratia quinivorans]|jgi:hypothetical protein|uniref:Uncharacterized protein n=1 Tax=Serratia quinivorans TaxID=137545 RepID=A0A2X2H660_9GAMM|nr:hypothetical protein [Serratia sp. BIGb0163]CAI0736863.1 Uncharacterised protein [Serratia quinivorans]CAI0756566.1 Uncharacterised protein [Serratia quinivorans]CAI0795923.1 Uncharacterised protein [Serratia quinivorans]CAI0877697.1 Uncharacterised protein [Serratia quinivorans]
MPNCWSAISGNVLNPAGMKIARRLIHTQENPQ